MPPPGGGDDLLRQMQETLESDPSNPAHHYDLGLFLWTEGEEGHGEDSKHFKERAAEHFLAAAKLNPVDDAAFRFLGHYYSKVSVDAQRASKCYQRAVTLNPEDSESGESLCDLLDGEGKESLEIALCKEVSEKSPRAFWAFRRLGYLQVHQRRWSEAVPSLQHAIRGYPASADLWEALGLAYHRLGMFTAAIKSYGRAIELESSRIFALIDSGYIQLMLGSFRKGVEQFRCALELAPHSLSAHYGLASSLLAWSKDCVRSGAYSWGTALLKEASEVADASTLLSGNSFSAWKLNGDIKIAFSKCFPWGDERICDEIDKGHFKASVNGWKMECHSAANSAKNSYQRALHLAPWKANIYTDIAISLDIIYSMEDGNKPDPEVWQLTEKMSLGGLMLEGVNKEFWVILGCMSPTHALKQHALIRGLQLDVSLSLAWACLGKLYRHLGKKQLARLAFDQARSFDPSVALPWAGMSADYQDKFSSPNEAYESCLRAVQILPLAEFQIGLGTLATLSGHLLSPQVFSAIRQAVQRVPDSPESHNLNGLICEARGDYESAIAAYWKARWALDIIEISNRETKTHIYDVSFNLARSLHKAGRAFEAMQECEELKKEGLLDDKGLQVYAVVLWQVGQFDLALTTARKLAKNVASMKQTCAAAALGLICTLVYSISGKDFLIATIQKLPTELLRSTRMNFILYALNALDPSNQLQSLLPTVPETVTSHDVLTELQSITAVSKMISHGAQKTLVIESGINYLRKVVHMHPNSSLIRSQLSSLLLSSSEWEAPRKAVTLTCAAALTREPVKKGLRLPYEIHGAAGVACYVCSSTCPKFSFPTCKDQVMHEVRGIHYLQRWLHQEPWNQNTLYLLVLGLLQKACEEQFPQQLCIILKRMVSVALSVEKELAETKLSQYRQFLLLLCASEISLQCGDFLGCINYVSDALKIPPPYSDPFFAHLQLCRAYAAQEDLSKLENEFINCLQIKTVHPIGWILLKYLESRYKFQNMSSITDASFQACAIGNPSSSKNWAAIYDLACAQSFLWDHDYFHAEQALSRGCAESNADSCILLCHGAICLELVRQQSGSQFLSRAARSLMKAQEKSLNPLPIVSLLLAQAEASLGAKAKWEWNIRLEWFAWPAGKRPAELYFQMHLLAKQSVTGTKKQTDIESSQSPERWVLRAIHLNPSCLRYWKVLQKIRER